MVGSPARRLAAADRQVLAEIEVVRQDDVSLTAGLPHDLPIRQAIEAQLVQVHGLDAQIAQVPDAAGGDPHVRERFPTIHETCLEAGIDVTA